MVAITADLLELLKLLLAAQSFTFKFYVALSSALGNARYFPGG